MYDKINQYLSNSLVMYVPVMESGSLSVYPLLTLPLFDMIPLPKPKLTCHRKKYKHSTEIF